MEEQDIIRALAALAHEIRLRVFRALVVAGQDGLTPGALSEQLAIAPNTLLGGRWMSAEEIVGPPFSVDRLFIDMSVRF